MAREDDTTPRRSTRSAPPAAPPPIVTQFQNNDRAQWLRLAAYALVAFIVVAGVVLGGRWLYNRGDDDPNRPAPTANNDKRPAETPPAERDRNGASNGDDEIGDNRRDSNGENRRLANTGPSEVIAVFAATTMAVAGLHYIVSIRRHSH